MEKFLNFKKVEVVGATKAEAIAKAPFEIMGDATQAYKNWKAKQKNGITDKEVTQFCVEYLEKHSKNVANVGFSITLEAAVADTRERPYTITDIKNEQGKRKYKTIYQWVDSETKAVVCSVDTTKADAKNALKKLYTDSGYKGDATLYMVKQVIQGEPIAAKAKYTPSKSFKNGVYLTFGIEKA